MTIIIIEKEIQKERIYLSYRMAMNFMVLTCDLYSCTGHTCVFTLAYLANF